MKGNFSKLFNSGDITAISTSKKAAVQGAVSKTIKKKYYDTNNNKNKALKYKSERRREVHA